MHQTDVNPEPTPEQMEQVANVIDALWDALKKADGLPVPIVLKIIGTVAADIIEQSDIEIVPINVENTTMQ